MAKKKKAPAGAPAWMCTFADMMSLLLCFFVLILSFATLDEPSFRKVTGSIKDALGARKKSMMQEMPQAIRMISPEFETIPFHVKEEFEALFQKDIESGLVTVEEDSKGEITLRIKDSLVFDFGSAQIKDDFKPFLDKLGKIAKDSDATLEVGGHTDNVRVRPGAPFKSNWGLSAARAVEVLEYMAAGHDLPSHRLAIGAYADGRPVAVNDTAEGRSANRRVEFKVKPGEGGKVFEGFQGLIELKQPESPIPAR